MVEARRVGALPIMIFEDEDAYVDSVKNTPKDIVGKMGRHEYELLQLKTPTSSFPMKYGIAYTK